MVICLEQGADLHMVQLMPLPLTVSCFSKIQIGFTFLVPAHPGSPGKRAVRCVCVWCSEGDAEELFDSVFAGIECRHKKMAEPIQLPFRVWTRVGPRSHVLGGGPDLLGEGATLWGISGA